MKEKVGLLIAVSLFILFFLVILTSILSKKGQNLPSSLKPTINPTLDLNQINKVKDNALKNDKVVFFEKNILPKIKVLPKDEAQKMIELTKKLPLENEDFSAIYLPLSNRIVFFVKNEKGRQKVDDFLRALNLAYFPNQYPHLITVTDNWSIVESLKKNEENLMAAKSEAIKSSLNQPESSIINQSPNQSTFNSTVSPASPSSPSLSPSPFDNSFIILAEMLKIFYENIPTNALCSESSCSNLNPSPTASNQPFSPSPFPTIFNPPINLPSLSSPGYQSLQSLFKEAGEKVGVPPKILEGVAFIEYKPTFNLSPEEINLYSQPGATWPGCPLNECSATGPMQITTGKDKFGSTNCSSCCNNTRCLTSCPNQWSSYGNAVNIFTNENRQPNPCNLKDNIYAAAYKLKTDANASDSLSWTQDEVYKAAENYHGSCSENYRYARLGNRTYCEFLWWYYTSK
jgi:hypothetical protein